MSEAKLNSIRKKLIQILEAKKDQVIVSENNAEYEGGYINIINKSRIGEENIIVLPSNFPINSNTSF